MQLVEADALRAFAGAQICRENSQVGSTVPQIDLEYKRNVCAWSEIDAAAPSSLWVIHIFGRTGDRNVRSM